MPEPDDIVTRLRTIEGIGEGTHWYRNPDGPEAAAEITRLRAALHRVNLAEAAALAAGRRLEGT